MNQMLLTQMLIAIVNVFNAEEIIVEPQPVITSVHVTTFPFRLLNAGKSKVNIAKNLSETMESALGIAPIRISRKMGLINVEIPLGTGERIYCERLPVNKQSMTVTVGLDTTNELITHDFTTYPHLAFVGRTNFGKTSNARSVIYQLLKQNPTLELYICCYKAHDWSQFAGCATILTDENDMLQMLQSAGELMARRGKAGVKTPTILIVLDDATQLVDNKEIVAQLAHLAPLCRGMGILLMPILQRLTGLDSRFTGNLSAKIMFSVASAQDAALLSGHGGSGAELLSRPGDALYMTDANPVRMAALSLRDETQIANRDYGKVLQHCNSQNEGLKQAENSEFDTLMSRYNATNARLVTVEKLVNTVLQRVEIKGKPKTEQERAYIKAVFELSGQNLRKTSGFVYGYETGNYFNYTKEVCTDAQQNGVDEGESFIMQLPVLQNVAVANM